MGHQFCNCRHICGSDMYGRSAKTVWRRRKQTLGMGPTLLLLLLLVAAAGRCEPVTVPMCSSDRLPYNLTLFPNLLGHADQEEAGRRLSAFRPLVSAGCSRALRPSLPLRAARPGLHRPGDARPAVQGGVRGRPPRLQDADGTVRILLAGRLRVLQVSRRRGGRGEQIRMNHGHQVHHVLLLV